MRGGCRIREWRGCPDSVGGIAPARRPRAGGDPVTLFSLLSLRALQETHFCGRGNRNVKRFRLAAGHFCLGKSHQNRSRWSRADAMKLHRCPVLLVRRGTTHKLAALRSAQACAPLRPRRPAVRGVLRQREAIRSASNRNRIRNGTRGGIRFLGLACEASKVLELRRRGDLGEREVFTAIPSSARA